MRRETAAARTLLLDVPDLAPATAGQHVDVRLTAEDGYTAQRSYSLASATGAQPIEITVERFEDGEVSPYLVDEVGVGDVLEVRGPIGGWFVWRESQREPVQLIAGGSGIVPLMAMVRTRTAVRSAAPFRLLYGLTGPDRFLYRDELERIAGHALGLTVQYSRRVPPGSSVVPHRIGIDDLARAAFPPDASPTVYVCGPTGFVESVADALLRLGHQPARIRTERFGPTG
ncbi:ferredoxin reductase [Amnibacterium sp. CER49]|uniref:ferredoxin reductase n=1 Tax=Amnibacterium sp. CER49 TaxID=3039161 RepID=UPI00244B8720|nr:ferredoxin reductase [Amnibacterium sp. CER49]MDH2442872.1 ferredoxin reductase [Amnibacterium sp. CER49]